jgi:hypothetical protein
MISAGLSRAISPCSSSSLSSSLKLKRPELISSAASPWPEPTSPTRWFAISGVALFSGLFAYLILQHADRHRMAKQQLIELEKAFGLYDNGWQLSGNALFPKNWQSDWTADRSVSIYLTILAALTALVICAMLVRV